MKLNQVFTFNFAVNLLFGVGLVAAPVPLASLFGLALNPGSMLICRLLGAMSLGLGLVLWRLRSTPSDVALLVTAPLALADALGFACSLLAMLDRALNPLGWLVVALHASFALAYANFAFGQRHVIGPAV